MAVKLEEIVEYLENMNYNFKHKIKEDDEYIRFNTSDDDSSHAHFIRARDDGSIFEWKMLILNEDKIFKIKNHKHSGLVRIHLLYLNYKTKFGTWEMDPNDGEIRLMVEIPLEDALMTENQFKRIKGFMVRDGDSHADEIHTILETGKLPYDNEEEDEVIVKVEAMLAKLNDEASADSSVADDLDDDEGI